MDIYRSLQRRIDELPIPFPEAESGAEIRLLQALFDEEEALIALQLSGRTETVDTISRRLPQIGIDDLRKTLTRLAKRGAINSSALRVGKRVERTFGLAPLVVGMFEFQVDKLTPDYVRTFHEYLEDGFRDSLFGVKTSQLRTVPVRASLASDRTVARYDDIRAHVEAHPGPFSVINCVCRQAAGVTGEACTTSSSHETCLMLGHVPPHSRKLTKDEFIGILDRAETEGHVLNPQNSRNPSYICCCCKDCCEVLSNARKLPRPADVVSGAYLARVDADACTGCRTCLKRCPMESITVNDRLARVEEGRCIGCGLCATTCPEEAITIVGRPGVRATPRNNAMMYLRMEAERRGILGVARMAARTILGKKV